MSKQYRRPLVVGIDDTSAGQYAVRWAVEEAQRRGCAVRVISAYDAALPAATAHLVDRKPPPPALKDRFDDAVAYAADRLGPDRAEGCILSGRPAAVLVDESITAELVVVGGRSRSPIGALVMGSVSAAVAAEAACSVVVVHPRAERVRPSVVVGVDGSDGANVALAAAFEAAESRRLPLEVLHCWQPYVYIDQVPQDRELVARQRCEREHWLAETVVALSEKHPAVSVSTHLVEGRTAEQLAYRSETAVLVVVGSRGRGVLPGLLLGSVSQRLLCHARCTVMVAREHGH